MNKLRKVRSMNLNRIQIKNKNAIYSNYTNDIIFSNKNIKGPLFVSGIIENIEANVYDFQKNQIILYISDKIDLNIELSTNLIFKINDSTNLKLIFILPYASYAMKTLRLVNPKLGQQMIIVGYNIFTILLTKLLTLSGISVKIIKLKSDLYTFNKLSDIKSEDIIDGLSKAEEELRNNEIDTIIIENDSDPLLIKLLDNVKAKNLFYLNQVPIYDIGFKDPNYISGEKYPFSYIRWNFNSNLKYFINLVEKNQLDISYIKLLEIDISSIEEMEEFIKNNEEDKLIIFKL